MNTIKPVFVLIAVICAVTGLKERITGGGLATAGQFPYVVSITENGRHFCGGFIYSERWVVTTASCLYGKSKVNLKVIVGQLSTINPDVNEQIMDVYTVTLFPQYNSTTRANDVALIWLTANITFYDQYIDFIPYGENENTPPTATVMGWGATFEGGYESVNLRYAEVFIKPINDTNPCKGYGNTELDFATMICCTPFVTAMPAPGVPCQYDEGSPLIQNVVDPATSVATPIAIGVLSSVNGCAVSTSFHNIFTRLSAYYQWFLNTAGQQPVRP